MGVESKEEMEMTAKENQELQRQTLYVQLKILKELRILNKTLTRGIHNSYTRIEPQMVNSGELDDVQEALSLTGFNLI